MISAAFTPMLRARSPTVTPSVIRTIRLEAFGVVISVLRCSLPGKARRFLGTRSPRISRSAATSGTPFLTTFFFLIARAPGLEASGGGAKASGIGATADGPRRRSGGRGVPPGRGPVGTVGREAGAGLRKSILPSTLGPRGPSSSDGAAACARLVRLIVLAGSCGRCSGRRGGAPAPGARAVTPGRGGGFAPGGRCEAAEESRSPTSRAT